MNCFLFLISEDGITDQEYQMTVNKHQNDIAFITGSAGMACASLINLHPWTIGGVRVVHKGYQRHEGA